MQQEESQNNLLTNAMKTSEQMVAQLLCGQRESSWEESSL